MGPRQTNRKVTSRCAGYRVCGTAAQVSRFACISGGCVPLAGPSQPLQCASRLRFHRVRSGFSLIGCRHRVEQAQLTRLP
jgi:hypothetical protein